MRYKIKNSLYMFGVVSIICFLSGCSGSLGNISANDPTERGLSYIAAAIVTASIIKVIFGK